MPSTLASDPYSLHYHLPPLPQKRDVRSLDADSCKRLQLDQNSLTHWLRTSATVDHGLRTPPREMTGMNGNPLLAPDMGGMPYKSVPAVRSTTSYSTSLDTVANNKYHSKAPPSHDFYRSMAQPQSPVSQRENAVRGQNARSSADSTSIAPYLQIPATINNSKGSLAEFAAQVCCLHHGRRPASDTARLRACSGSSPPISSNSSKNRGAPSCLQLHSCPKQFLQLDFENGSPPFCPPPRLHKTSYCWL